MLPDSAHTSNWIFAAKKRRSYLQVKVCNPEMQHVDSEMMAKFDEALIYGASV